MSGINSDFESNYIEYDEEETNQLKIEINNKMNDFNHTSSSLCSTASGASASAADPFNGKQLNNDTTMLKETRQISKRFYVRSLGWVKIDENDLTPERSSKAVNRCINDLSRGFRDINDVVARWGEVNKKF